MKINIDGVGVVNVGDEFKSLSPDDQNAFVANIANQVAQGKKSGLPETTAAPALNKYDTAAKKKADVQAKLGLLDAGVGQKLLQGMTFGGSDEALALAETVPAMIENKTFNPVEGYNYAKAFQNEKLRRSGENTGLAGDVAELAGGVLTGGNLAKAGKTLVKEGQSLVPRIMSMAGEGAGYGAVTGALTGEDSGRFTGAASGAAVGGLLGGAIPAAGGIGNMFLSPVASNIMARVDPSGAARARVARAIGESGRSARDIFYDMGNASAAGQGEYAFADALGNPGQRLLSTVARAPGEGRTQVVDFLNARQSGQADRVGGIIDAGLGADRTGRQATEALRRQAQSDARPLYKAANEYPIQWTPETEAYLNDPIIRQALNQGIETQRLESLARNPASHNAEDFTIRALNEAGAQPGVQSAGPNMRVLNAVKTGLDDMLDAYRDKTTGRLVLDEQGRAIDQLRRSYINHLDQINPLYQQARRAYAGPAAEREAVGRGQTAATRGRAADNLEEFQRLTPTQQRGFRVGYADKISEGIERGAEGVNAARRFTSNKFKTELPELSLYQGPMRPGEQNEIFNRLGRENTMFETRNQALGGSKTADNLADQAENQIDPRVFGLLARGDFLGAGGQFLRGAGNVVGGNTPAVRKAMADILLSTEQGGAARGLLKQLAYDRFRQVRGQKNATRLMRGLLAAEGEFAGSR